MNKQRMQKLAGLLNESNKPLNERTGIIDPKDMRDYVQYFTGIKTEVSKICDLYLKSLQKIQALDSAGKLSGDHDIQDVLDKMIPSSVWDKLHKLDGSFEEWHKWVDNTVSARLVGDEDDDF